VDVCYDIVKERIHIEQKAEKYKRVLEAKVKRENLGISEETLRSGGGGCNTDVL
jgi:hypothetical protein